MKFSFSIKGIIFLCLIFFSCSLFALDSKNLVENKWKMGSKHPDIGVSIPEIEFLKNGKYHITTYDDYEHIETISEGAYKLKNNVLTISKPSKTISEKEVYDKRNTESLDDIFYAENNFQCVLVYEDDYQFFDCLYYFSNKYFALKSVEPQKENAVCYDILNRSYSDYTEGKVVKHSGKLYATDNLKLRSKPGLSEKTGNCYYRKFDEYLKAAQLDSRYQFKFSKSLSVLLAGYVVEYDAYTYEKTEIDGMIAPWYRIILDGYDFWIYGGYVKEFTSSQMESANKLLIASALEKGMIQETGTNSFKKTYNNIASLSKEEVIKSASIQMNVESFFTEDTSYIYKAYKENRYDLFKPLNKIGYKILLRDKSSHPATVFKYIIDDNNIRAAKDLVEAGYGQKDTEGVFLNNEFDTFSLTKYLLKNGKKEMLEYFYSVGFDLLGGGSYNNEGGESKSTYTSFFYAINNKDAIDFLLERGLDINAFSIEQSYDGVHKFTTLDYAIKNNSKYVDYIKSKGGVKAEDL